MTDWQKQAEHLRFEKQKSWTEIAYELAGCFPGLTTQQVREKVRDYIRRHANYQKQAQPEQPTKTSIEYRQDGTIISEKFITLRDGQDMTPKFILEAHGMNPSLWEVVSYKNNFWNSQLKGGFLQISYQSKLTAKPLAKGIDLEEIDKHFKALDRQHFTPPVIEKRDGSMMAEINIADLHLGKLCWHGNTPGDYDHKIAKDLFYRIIGEIAEGLKDKPLEYVLFVWTNDFFNSDNEEQTTTGGTPQDTDVREQKLFNVGCEMLIRGVEILQSAIKAPIRIFYTPSNHDLTTGYHALKVIQAWFRQDESIEINADAYPRKYILYGNTLLGFTHGDKENDKGSKEKASRLASLMPIEARELWGKALYHEMHAAHLHSEQMIQEINGVIVRRISSPTAPDTYHTTYGYLGAVRKAQTFLYDKERGLMQIINTPV